MNDTIIDIINLHPKEVQLLKSIRNNWRFGEITIITRDGLPVRLRRVIEFDDLQNTWQEKIICYNGIKLNYRVAS